MDSNPRLRGSAGSATVRVGGLGSDATVPADAPEDPAPSVPLRIPRGVWTQWAAWIWAAILLVQVARVAWSYTYLRRLKAKSLAATGQLKTSFEEWILSCGVRRPMRLLISTEIESPMAVGFLRPAVILPDALVNGASERDLDHVLLHEVAHLARNDDWTNLLSRVLGGVLALHPLAWWILREIEQAREQSCDDWVVSETGEARLYAASLARMFELCVQRRGEVLATGMATRASHLGERIERLLSNGHDYSRRVRASAIAAACIALAGAVALAASVPSWVELTGEPIPTALEQAPPTQPPPATAAPKPRPAPPTKPAPQPAPAPAPAAAAQGQGFLAALKAAGYSDLSVDQIVEMKVHGIDAAFIDGMNRSGWGHLTPREMIELKVQGVSPDYITRMRQAGLQDLSLREVIELKIHGMDPLQISEIRSLGYGPYTTRQSIEFAIHGIRPDYFKALKESGFTNAEARDIIEAKIQGLSADNLKEARKFGDKLTLRQVIKLKQAGVI